MAIALSLLFIFNQYLSILAKIPTSGRNQPPLGVWRAKVYD